MYCSVAVKTFRGGMVVYIIIFSTLPATVFTSLAQGLTQSQWSLEDQMKLTDTQRSLHPLFWKLQKHRFMCVYYLVDYNY